MFVCSISEGVGMQEIEQVVAAAQRRLNLTLFLKLFVPALFAGLALVVAAWLAPKFWSLRSWMPGLEMPAWYAGSLLVGLLLGVALAGFQLWRRRPTRLEAAVEVDQRYSLRERLSSALALDAKSADSDAGRALLAGFQLWRRRPTRLEAAVEVDQRYSLRERLSSALALDAKSADSDAGRALLADAAERAARIDVRDQFPIRLERRAAWLLLPIAAIAGLALIPDATPPQPVVVTPVVNEQKPIEVAVEVAKKSLEEKAKQLEEQGLKDAAADLETLARKLDAVPAGAAELKKEALVKINDVREQLEQKRSELGDVDALKENLAKLKQAGEGAMEKLTQALADSDFEQARELVKELARKIKAGELSEQERQRLGEDLKKLAEAADKLVKEHEQAKRDLEAQMRQAQAEGNLQKAADLQRKLEQREAVERQMQQLRKAAENLQRAGEAVQPGQKQPGESKQKPSDQSKSGGQQQAPKASPGPGQSEQSSEQKSGSNQGEENLQQAQQALEDLAEQMEQMENDQEMGEQLQELEQELQDCKDGINGCKNPGDNPSRKRSQRDFVQGEGNGHGKREVEENETGDYRSKVKGRIQKGETVTTGDADGPNLPGSSAAEARELIKSELNRQTDPLEDQQLPRAQREQAKEYFQRLRGGK